MVTVNHFEYMNNGYCPTQFLLQFVYNLLSNKGMELSYSIVCNNNGTTTTLSPFFIIYYKGVLVNTTLPLFNGCA